MIVATVDFRLIDQIADVFFQVTRCGDDTLPDTNQINELLAECCIEAMGPDWMSQYPSPSDAAAMILTLHLLKQIEAN